MLKDRILSKGKILNPSTPTEGQGGTQGRAHFPSCSCGAARGQDDADSDELRGALCICVSVYLRHSGLCVSESNGPNNRGQRAGHPQAGACTAVPLHSSSSPLPTGTCQPVMAPATPTAPWD